MKIAGLRAFAVVAVGFGCGVTAPLDAQEPAGPGEVAVERPAVAPQDLQASVVTSGGRHEQSATMERQQVRLRDGATVTVLRPVAAAGEQAPGQEEDVRRETPLTWQVAAGRRLWLIDPATGDLRTCAVRQTSTVGVEAIRCLFVSGGGL
jgi:hypothetical protein